MITLLDYFIRLLRLQTRPQDLPASPALLSILMLLAILVGAINGIEFLGGLQGSLLLNMLDAAITAALLGITLQITGKTGRFVQAASAFFGVGSLLVLAILVINQIMVMVGQNIVGAIALLLVSIWSQVVYGHILRHTLDIRLGTGIIIALAYSVLSFLVVSQFISTGT